MSSDGALYMLMRPRATGPPQRSLHRGQRAETGHMQRRREQHEEGSLRDSLEFCTSRMHVCRCVHVHAACTGVCVQVHARMCTAVFRHMQVHSVYASMCMCAYECTRVHVCRFAQYMHACVCRSVYVCGCIHMYVCAGVCTCVSVQVHVRVDGFVQVFTHVQVHADM